MEKKVLEDIRDFLVKELFEWHSIENPKDKYNLARVDKVNRDAVYLSYLIGYADELGIDIRNEETKKYVKEN